MQRINSLILVLCLVGSSFADSCVFSGSSPQECSIPYLGTINVPEDLLDDSSTIIWEIAEKDDPEYVNPEYTLSYFQEPISDPFLINLYIGEERQIEVYLEDSITVELDFPELNPALLPKVALMLFDTDLNLWRSAVCPGTVPKMTSESSISFEVCHFTLFVAVVPLPVPDRDPMLEWGFRLICEEHLDSYFTGITGIKNANEWECERFTTVNGREVTSCLPSQLVVEPVVLTKPVTFNQEMWDWRDQVANGLLTESRQDCGILLYDRAYRPVIVYYMYNAWPTSISLKPLGTMNNMIKQTERKYLFEEITMIHEGLKRDGQPYAQKILAP